MFGAPIFKFITRASEPSLSIAALASGARLTLFKGMGMGRSDVAVAAVVVADAEWRTLPPWLSDRVSRT